MKVSILTYVAHTGAFAAVARNIVKGLAALDVTVEVLYLHGPDPALICGYPSGTRLLRLGGRSRTCWLALARHLRKSRPDALISLGWILNPAAVVAVAVARTRTPLFLNEASLLSYKTRVEHRDDRWLRHAGVLARLLYPRATAVTGVSAAVVADLVEEVGLDPQQVPLRVIPNAVDAPEIVARSLADAEIVSGPEPVFVNVARHARQKNLPLLLRAFRSYLTDGGSGTLALIGAGPETQNLWRLACDLDIAGGVRFLGDMANPFPQVAAATAFVLSSEEEGFGLVLVEAMALGVPVIATDCPGAPRDILLNGHAGLLVPSRDEAALAAAMRRVATDAGLRSRLSSSGKRRAEDFSPVTVGRQWLDLIRWKTLPATDLPEGRAQMTPMTMKEPAKIAIYYPRAMHGDGGVTNSLWLWADSFHRAGVDVKILYDPHLTVSDQRVVPNGVRVRPVPHRGRGRLAYPCSLGRHIDSSEVLVLHSGNVMFNIVAGAAAARRGVPYVVTPHGAYDPLVRRTRRAIKTVWEVAERRLLERAAAVHVFLPAEIEHVRQLAPSADTITAATAFEVPVAAWSAEHCGGYVAWLGRYDVRHKGLDRLLDAMAQLPPRDRPPLRMHGRDHKDSRQVVQHLVDERRLADHVTVGGPIDGSEKERFLLGAAAFVHPARWESLPVAMAETLAYGVPCLATLDLNLGVELARADAALVVEGTVGGLAMGLRAVAAGQLAPYGSRGRSFVRDRLSHEAAARQFLDGLAALRPSGVTR